jgi:hypothetical protein
MTTAPPITTETILGEDGADAALVQFASEVREGEERISNIVANAEAGARWTFSELRDRAGGGHRKTAMGVALLALHKAGVVQIDFARWMVAPA